MHGKERNGIARLNADGSLDVDFIPGLELPADGKVTSIRSIAVQPDGKILVGGTSLAIGGEQNFTLARLNPDGSLDTGFEHTGKYNGIVILVQPDGKILIPIARLNSDGSLETAFSANNISIPLLNTMALQQDGKILIGGMFRDQVGAFPLLRLNPDLTLDADFVLTRSSNQVSSIAVQPDGKILIGGGYFPQSGGNIARLNENGSFDNNFYPDESIFSRFLNTINLQPDGKIIISGLFSLSSEDPNLVLPEGLKNILRLNTNGSLDTSFDVGTIEGIGVYSISLQPDGKLVIGGNFKFIKDDAKNNLARIFPDGTQERDFNPSNDGLNDTVLDLVVQPDGKILIGGEFSAYDGVRRNHIARLNPDGDLDNSFNPGTGANSAIRKIAIQPDGKILFVGSFTTFNNTSRRGVARLNSDGSLDESFNPGAYIPSGVINDISVQSDGKILIAGGFGFEINRRNMARLNSDGSLDESFDPGEELSKNYGDEITDILIQPDGKILVSGFFAYYHPEEEPPFDFGLTRLNEDGSPDTSFSDFRMYIGYQNRGPSSFALQQDGKILLFGFYSTVRQDNVIRLNPDGSRDEFNISLGFSPSPLTKIVLQPDGKILVPADYTDPEGVTRKGIARFFSDGTLDESFDPGEGPNGEITSLAFQNDGKILLGGNFTNFNQVNAFRIARLLNDFEETDCKTEIKAKAEVILQLDDNGQATLTAAMADDGSSSTCGPVELEVSRNAFTCTDIGEQTVDFIVIDQSGKPERVPVKVIVADEIKPQIKVDQRLFVAVTRTGDTFRMPDFTKTVKGSDNCSFTLTQNPEPGTVFKHSEIGYVEFEAKDPSGNIAEAKFKFVLIFFNWNMIGKYFRETGEGNEGLVTVPWNTPFEKLIREGLVFEAGSDQEIPKQIQWNPGGYDPLTPGYYQVDGYLENSGFEGMDVSLQVPVIVLNKPMPEDIVLTNNVLPENLKPGEIIGSLETLDPVDNLHSYSMDEHPDFSLEKGNLVWKGEGMPPLESKITVYSTDRAGQTIRKEIFLISETSAPNDALVYPNPSNSHTNLFVKLALGSEVRISIYDAAGRKVYEEEGYHQTSFTRSLDFSGYGAGMYQIFVQVDHQLIFRRFVKK